MLITEVHSVYFNQKGVLFRSVKMFFGDRLIILLILIAFANAMNEEIFAASKVFLAQPENFRTITVLNSIQTEKENYV